MYKVMILGAGSFGISLSKVFNDNNNDVTLWSYSETQVLDLKKNRENKILLKGIYIDDNIKLTSDISLVKGIDFLVIAVPSFCVVDILHKVKPFISKKTVVINASKGMVQDKLVTFSVMAKEILPNNEYVVLSGPSHAEEVAKKCATVLVAACLNIETSKKVQILLNCNYIRVYSSVDVIGVEVCGALKNVIALAVGVLEGAKVGDNAKAAIMTRGLKEIVDLGIVMGGNIRTFYGVSGMGDLIVTCTSEHSRNRRAGILIGNGINPEETIKKIGTVEGYSATKISYNLSKKYSIKMPITEAIYSVLFENKEIEPMFKGLMLRPFKNEIDDLDIYF